MMNVQYMGCLDSTQAEAKRQITAGKILMPTMIVAEQQTNGYGRYKRPFYSPTNGLYVSMILPSTDVTCRTTLLTHATAVALVSVLTQSGYTGVGIKWINDLYVAERKVAGILIEQVQTPDSTYYVIGIGLNLNKQTIPTDLHAKMGTLTHTYVSPRSLIPAIWETLLMICTWADDDILQRYRQSCIVLGRHVQATRGHETVTGQAIRIDAQGGLVIQTNTSEETLRTGELVRMTWKEEMRE